MTARVPSELGLGESQRLILEQLKRRGSGTVPELAERLQLSVETIRNHLKSLCGLQLTGRNGTRIDGPGRPEIVYTLTEHARRYFPRRDAETLSALAAFLEEEGRGAVIRDFFRRQGEKRRQEALDRIEGLEGRDRLDEVARILTDEGFMAEIETDPSGRSLLRLCNCPIRSLIDVSRAPCRAELGFVRALLGRRLTRVSYIPSGDTACCYAIEEC